MSEEEKKKLYTYMLIAALIGGGGGTGLQLVTSKARSDPCTGTMCREIKQLVYDHRGEDHKYFNELANELSTLRREVYTKDQVKEKIAAIRVIDQNLTEDIKQIRQELRQINVILANRPPQALLSRVSNLELWREHFDRENAWLKKQIEKVNLGR